MILINWSSEYSVNVHDLDRQHKKLITLINSLYNHVKHDKKKIGITLIALLEYTQIHFEREEELMVKYNHPEYTVHKSEHRSFIQKILNMQKKYSIGDVDLFPSLAIMMNDWYEEHLRKMDKNYSLHFEKIGVKLKK